MLALIVCLALALLAAPALAGHKDSHGGGGNGNGGKGNGGKGGADTTADLAVTLADAPDPVEVGQELTYTAGVRNNGPAKATGVSFTDPLPESVTFVSATGNRGASCGLSGGTVTCQISRLNSGATATISIVVRPTAAGTVSNSVAVGADQSDPDFQNNQASTSTTVTEAAPPPPEGCTGHTWFLGIVFDEERRSDFEQDVDHFRRFLDTLRTTHCIPPSQARILEPNDGSEANLKAELQRMASEANQHADSQFFFFLSSHGLVYVPGLSACEPTRAMGSYAALKGGGAEDGFLDDCELGAELARFAPTTRMFVAVDCSFCGGFSDSLTAASGTVPDGGVPTSSGVPADNRVVVTGCAMTTECFASRDGGNLYRHMNNVREAGVAECDGWTAPGFPALQGANVPVRGVNDGRCTTSEWFFAAVNRAYTDTGQVTNLGHLQDDALSIQQQFRIKYGFDSLADDLIVR